MTQHIKMDQLSQNWLKNKLLFPMAVLPAQFWCKNCGMIIQNESEFANIDMKREPIIRTKEIKSFCFLLF